MDLPYRQRMERERDRLLEARRRLLSDRRYPSAGRVARGEYVAPTTWLATGA